MADTLVPDVGVLQDRLNAVEHLAGVGFWEWRIPENETMWSDSLFRIFGFEPGKFGPSYEAWLGLVHDDDREMVEGLVNAAFEQRSSYAFDHRIVWPDGQVRVLHCRGQVYSDDEGNPARIAGISEDVTRKRAVEEVERRFIADAAHELRTPVAAIEAAQQVLARADKEELRAVGLGALERQVRRLSDLTTSLLDLEAVRPDGRLGLVLTATPLAPVVQRAVASSHLDGDRPTVEVPADLAVRVEESHLDRVLVILLDNARRYGGEHVTVRAEVTPTHVRVEVADDGPGVPDDLVDNLFDPFSRGRHVDKTGAGLGLAICRRLVEGLGGRLSYEGGPTGGAVFVFTLEEA